MENLVDSSIAEKNVTVKDYFEYKVSKQLWIYISPVILVFGTVGNILSILVLCRKSIWRLSTAPFFVALAVADIFVLYSGLFRRWLLHFNETDIRVLSDAGCRIHVFCVYTSLHFSAWVIVLMTVSRFMNICFPLKAKSICTRRESEISILVALLFTVAVNSHELIARGFQQIDSGNSTEIICGHLSQGYRYFFQNIWPWIDLAISSGIPFTAIIICNSCIVWRVVMSHRFRKQKLSRISVPQDKRVSSMTAVLLVVNTVFLVTTAPSRIYLIGSPAWHEGINAHQEAVLLLIWALVNLLMYLNNAVNFILYCVSGKQFRDELMLLFCGQRPQIYPFRAKVFVYSVRNNITTSGQGGQNSLPKLTRY